VIDPAPEAIKTKFSSARRTALLGARYAAMRRAQGRVVLLRAAKGPQRVAESGRAPSVERGASLLANQPYCRRLVPEKEKVPIAPAGLVSDVSRKSTRFP
jgi:hypothetical protein